MGCTTVNLNYSDRKMMSTTGSSMSISTVHINNNVVDKPIIK